MSNKNEDENKKDDLKKSIEKLNNEHNLLSADLVEKRKALKSFISDLEYHVDNPEDKEHLENVIKTIPELIKMFEVKHPRLTDLLNKISMILSNMGI